MTTWLCGVEQRWTMAAPSCFVTTFRRNLENELPADTEQCQSGFVLWIGQLPSTRFFSCLKASHETQYQPS